MFHQWEIASLEYHFNNSDPLTMIVERLFCSDGYELELLTAYQSRMARAKSE